MKECVCDGRSEGPTNAVLSTRKLVQVEVEDIRRSLKVALTPHVGPIRSSPLIFCVFEAQEQCPMRISKVSCSQQPFLLRSRQQRFFSRREGEKSKKRKRPLATSLWGGGPNVRSAHAGGKAPNLIFIPWKPAGGKAPIGYSSRGSLPAAKHLLGCRG